MARIRWTLQAIEDIEIICSYIARDSDHFARVFAQNIFRKSNQIKAYPQSGRIAPEMQQEEIREIFHGNYRIIYRVVEDTAQILSVVHGSKSIDPAELKELLY